MCIRPPPPIGRDFTPHTQWKAEGLLRLVSGKLVRVARPHPISDCVRVVWGKMAKIAAVSVLAGTSVEAASERASEASEAHRAQVGVEEWGSARGVYSG